MGKKRRKVKVIINGRKHGGIINYRNDEELQQGMAQLKRELVKILFSKLKVEDLES